MRDSPASGTARRSTLRPTAIPELWGGGQRADYLGGQIYPDNPTRYNYFNPLVFGRPAQGTLGGMGRNALTGPGINQWDISMYKNTEDR